MALILVIGMGTILAILVVAAIGYAVSGVGFSRATQDTDGSLAAAYAGVEEFQSRLAADPGFWKSRQPPSTYSSSTGSVVTAPPATNPAFGVGTGGTWGASGAVPPRRRPRSDMRSTTLPTQAPASSGFGRPARWARPRVPSSRTSSSRGSSISCTSPTTRSETRRLECELCSRVPVGCRVPTVVHRLQFAKADVLNGAVHSNDTLLICGAPSTDSTPPGIRAARSYSSPSACSTRPSPWETPIQLGCRHAVHELTAQVGDAHGSHHGPEARLPVHRSDHHPFLQLSHMTVRSLPWTLSATNVAGDPATSGTNNALCGTPDWPGLRRVPGRDRWRAYENAAARAEHPVCRAAPQLLVEHGHRHRRHLQGRVGPEHHRQRGRLPGRARAPAVDLRDESFVRMPQWRCLR